MEEDYSDRELFQFLTDKLVYNKATPILEIPFALEYTPEFLPQWVGFKRYYYCYSDITEMSSGNRHVEKECGGSWRTLGSETVILDEAQQLSGVKVVKHHYRERKTTGWAMWQFHLSHTGPPVPDLNLVRVLIKVGYEAGLRDPTLEGLSMSLLSDGPDITREHPRNAAKRRKFE
nr:hypothetical protein Iba_chr05bCG0810 [Ipomoea batatas]